MKKSKIQSIKAREILNSKEEPTIEVELQTALGVFFASVPSGTSKGKYEAKELRDKGKRFFGKGVLKAIKNVEEIIGPKLKGKDATEQNKIDRLMIKMDGTKNKSRLGANAILGVSMAVCRAGAAAKNQELFQYISNAFPTTVGKALGLPSPCFLLIEGGVHAGNDLDFQEFMVVPRASSFKEKVRIGTEIYHTLGMILEKKYGQSAINVGMEGGFAPPLQKTEQALDLIMEAIKKAGFTDKVGIILDVAASEFYKNEKYKMGKTVFTQDGFLNYYSKLIQKYPIMGLEDPFSEDDWESFKKITSRGWVSIIGDDLTVTNLQRVKKAVSEKAINGLIIKPNQIGTVSETLEAARFAKENNLKIFVKHRSGETNDDFISDLAVGLNADGIMAGAPHCGERVAKYNRLLKVEEELKKFKN